MSQPQPFVVSSEEMADFLLEHVLYPDSLCHCGREVADPEDWTEHVADAYLEEFVR